MYCCFLAFTTADSIWIHDDGERQTASNAGGGLHFCLMEATATLTRVAVDVMGVQNLVRCSYPCWDASIHDSSGV